MLAMAPGEAIRRRNAYRSGTALAGLVALLTALVGAGLGFRAHVWHSVTSVGIPDLHLAPIICQPSFRTTACQADGTNLSRLREEHSIFSSRSCRHVQSVWRRTC